MTLHGRALTLLKEVHMALTEDLADVDLVALKRSTVDPMDVNATNTWVRLLETLSPTLVAFGNEVTAIDNYEYRRRTSTVMMWKSLMGLSAVVVIIITFSATRVNLMPEFIPRIITLAVLVTSMFTFFAIMKSWILMLSERNNKLTTQSRGFIIEMMRRYRHRISRRPLIIFAAAVTSGTGLAMLSENLSKSKDSVDGNLVNRDGIVCPSNGSDDGKECEIITELCQTGSSLPPLASVVSRYCKDIMATMLDMLQEIKLDVEQYDRVALWRCVHDNVKALRKAVYIEYNELPENKLSASTIETILVKEVLPLLSLPATESTSFKIDPSSVGLFSTPPQRVDSKDACWRSCIQDGECKLAHYVADDAGAVGGADTGTGTGEATAGGGMCARSSSERLLESMTYVTDGTTASKIMLRRSDKPDRNVLVCGYATPQSLARVTRVPGIPESAVGADAADRCRLDENCGVLYSDYSWKTTPAETFRSFFYVDPNSAQSSGLSRACIKTDINALVDDASKGGIWSVLNGQAAYIASDLFSVVQKYKYQLDIAANRRFIDDRLANYYGHDLYIAKISKEVDRVVNMVQELTVEHTNSSKQNVYISAGQFVDNVIAMSDRDWSAMETSLLRISQCSKAHRDHFPAYRTMLVPIIFVSLLAYAVSSLFVVYIMYLLISYHKAITRVLPILSMVRNTIVVVCVLTIIVAVLETMVKKYRISATHNLDMVDANGDILLSSAYMAKKSMALVRESVAKLRIRPTAVSGIGGDGDRIDVGDVKTHAYTAKRYLQNTIEAFDRCNYITSQVATMPFPIVEVFVYCVIIALFLIVAYAAIGRLSPLDRLSDTRLLLDTRAQVKRGEITKLDSVNKLLSCCEPPNMVWELVVWLGILVLIMITGWFLYTTKDTADDYEDAVASNPNCIA